MRLRNFLMLFAVVAIAMVSCKKDKDEDDGLIASMGATITSLTLEQEDETSPVDTIRGDAKVLNIITRKALLINDVFTITGITLGGDVLNVTVRGSEEGKYVLDLGLEKDDPKARSFLTIGTSYTNIEGEVHNALFASSKGYVTLTKVDRDKKRVSGKFEFFVFSGDVYKVVEKGTFENLKYSTK